MSPMNGTTGFAILAAFFVVLYLVHRESEKAGAILLFSVMFGVPIVLAVDALAS